LRETGCRRSSRIGDLCISMISFLLPMGRSGKNQALPWRRSRDVAFSATQQLCWISITRSSVDYRLHALRLLGIARSTGDLDQLAHAYSRSAMSLTMYGFIGVGLRFVSRAERYVEKCRSPGIKAYASYFIGLAYYFAGRLGRAREVLADAQAKLEKYAHWSNLSATHALYIVSGALGDTENELAMAAKEITLGEQTDNAMARSWGEFGSANAMARSGRIEEAIVRSERAVELSARWESGYTYSRIVAARVRGFVLLQASRYADARVACEESRRLLIGSPFQTDLTLSVYAFLAESIMGPNWSAPPGTLDRRDLEKAWRLVRQANRSGRRFPNLLPHALRVRARAAWALGKRRTSARSLKESIDCAEKHGARYDLARAYLDASRVIPEKAEEYRRLGQKLLDELGAIVPEAETECSISTSILSRR
jgi:tetratricopeptide (TPR) repeat protein